MVAVTNTRAMFNRVPVGHFDPKEYIEIDTSEQIDTNTVPLNGGVLLKTLTLSIDPYQKERMRDEEEESYMVCPTINPCPSMN
jgi:NADPH-dependent curcumin reductase CurA